MTLSGVSARDRIEDRFEGAASGAARRFVEEARITGPLQHPARPPVQRRTESVRSYRRSKFFRPLVRASSSRPDVWGFLNCRGTAGPSGAGVKATL